MQTDADIIKAHGGPAQLAKKLGYRKAGSTQRVQNWITRGIPPRVKLERPDLFGGEKRRGERRLRAGSNEK